MRDISAYNKINIIFIFVILLVITYSVVFTPENNNYPIQSACKVKPCKSTGLSRAFSKIVRFDFKKALEYNKYSLQVFSFFLIQFFLRIFTIFILHKRILKDKFVMIFDIGISVILYLFTFKGLIFSNL